MLFKKTVMPISSLQHNLVFVKMQKCASSTTAGVVRLVALRHNLSGYQSEAWIQSEPGVWASHGAVSAYGPPSWALLARLQLPTLLLTMVREPLDRAISAFYHFVYTRHPECTPGVWRKMSPQSPPIYNNHTRNLIGYLASKTANTSTHCSGSVANNFMHNYMRPRHLPNVSPSQLVHMYSFVGVVERYNESMALLAKRLHLPIRELVALDAKLSAGGGVTGRRDDLGKRFYAHPTIGNEPEAVRAYALREWVPANALDYGLYRAADAALSRTFEADTSLSEAARMYSALLSLARKTCSSRQPFAEIRKCLYSDEACAYECVTRTLGV